MSVAENLAVEAKTLLAILNTELWCIREKFQIELRKINIPDNQCTYKMSLRIDPIPWFKRHAQSESDAENFEQLYQNGRCYFEKVKSETEHYFNTKSETEIKRLLFDASSDELCYNEKKGKTCVSKINPRYKCDRKHYQWCHDENYQGVCTNMDQYHRTSWIHFSNFKNEIKTIYQCQYESIKLNGKQEFCLFDTNPNCRIYADTVKKPSNYQDFIVSARPNATPVLTLNPIRHCSNEEYVPTCDAWQAVLQTLNYMKTQLKLDKLPLHSINVNFGKWMTQKVRDPTRQHCHAHINIVLTQEAINKINESRNKSPIFPSLVDSVLPPENYRLDDAWELMKYMDIQMMPKLIKENCELKRNVSDLKTDFEKLRHECENLRQVISDRKDDEQKIEEPTNIRYISDIGRRINDDIFMQETRQYHHDKWNRFLFPWNQI